MPLPRRGEWLPERRPRACEGTQAGGDERLAVDEISRRSPPVVPMRAEKKLYLAASSRWRRRCWGRWKRASWKPARRRGRRADGPCSDGSCSTVAPMRLGKRPAPGRRRFRHRRCRGRNGAVCARPARPAAYAGWLQRRDRARRLYPRRRRERHSRIPMNRRGQVRAAVSFRLFWIGSYRNRVRARQARPGSTSGLRLEGNF